VEFLNPTAPAPAKLLPPSGVSVQLVEDSRNIVRLPSGQEGVPRVQLPHRPLIDVAKNRPLESQSLEYDTPEPPNSEIIRHDVGGGIERQELRSRETEWAWWL